MVSFQSLEFLKDTNWVAFVRSCPARYPVTILLQRCLTGRDHERHPTDVDGYHGYIELNISMSYRHNRAVGMQAASFKSSFQIQNSKHLHAIARHSVLVFEDTDVSEAQSFDQGLNNVVG